MNNLNKPESVFKRVRKPPGGDTNDIFNLNVQQKVGSCGDVHIQEVTSQLQIAGAEVLSDGSEKMLNSSECSELDKENKSVPENNGMQLNDDLSKTSEKNPDLSDEENLKTDDENDDLKSSGKKDIIYNPITGASYKVNRLKLNDSSNKMAAGNSLSSKDSVDYGFSKPSIRVRHPPGGASSNIFM